MKVRIVCYEDTNLWILGKFALKLQEHLITMGFQCDIAKTPDLTADINHHIIYYDYDGQKSTSDTVMITHIDTEWKLEKIRKQLEVAELGICMSMDTVQKLATAGIPRDKLCYILPAHDEIIKPLPLVVGLTSKIHNDGRKREYMLPQLARHISPNDFMFRIMGDGWHEIVGLLKEMGFTVDYYDAFDYELNKRLVPDFDYYLYLGLDEGAMGFIDALAAAVPTIVTPQGYHLDAVDGITHPFVTLDDLIAVFQAITAERRKRTDAVKTWTWRNYAAKHAELWHWLAAGGNRTHIPFAKYKDGLNSLSHHSYRPEISTGDPHTQTIDKYQLDRPVFHSEQRLLEETRALLAEGLYEEAECKARSLLLLYPDNPEAISLGRTIRLINLKTRTARS